MFLTTLLFAAGLLVAETPDTLQAVTIVADKGVVVSRTDTVALRADGTAAAALLNFPGLGISDYGGLAGLKGVSLRGLGTPHTDIYLDGVRVSNFQSGQNDLGMLPVEVLGNAVVDYAQNSISFRTAKPVFGDRNFAGRVGLQAGSFGTWMPSARFDVKLSERVSLSAHGAGVITKGDFPIADEFIPRTADGSASTGIRRTGNDLKQIRTGIDLFGTLDGGEWQAKAYYNGSDRGTPGSLTWPSEDRQQDKNVVLQGSLRKAFSDLYTLNLSAKGAFDKIYYQSAWGDSDYNFKDFQLNSSHTFRLNDWWAVSLAADLEHGALKSTGYDAVRTAAQAALATAIRLERFSADLALQYNGTFDKGAKGLNSLSPSLDLRVTLFEGFDVVAFGRRAFRAPTFNELYYPGYGNPDLKPEDAWLTDIGIDWNTALSDAWSLGLKADFFYNYLQNKITSTMMEGTWIWLPINIGIVQAKGVDAALTLRYDDGNVAGGFSARYAHQCALDKTPDSATFNQQVPYIAKNTLVLAGDVEFAGWRFNALFNWRGGRYDSAGEMPDWNTLDLSLRKDFTLGNVGVLSLNVSVKDLLDYRYELVSDYPMPGRSFLGGFTFKF
jgi:outer membrane cobalamin receptor